jgi:hypothetical protein
VFSFLTATHRLDSQITQGEFLPFHGPSQLLRRSHTERDVPFSQGGRAANQWVLPHRWSLNIVKKFTIFQTRITLACGPSAWFMHAPRQTGASVVCLSIGPETDKIGKTRTIVKIGTM